MSVPLGSGIAMYGNQQFNRPGRAGQLVQQRAGRTRMTTHSHPTGAMTPEMKNFKNKEIGSMAKDFRGVAPLMATPREGHRLTGMADRIEAAAKRNIAITPSGSDIGVFEQSPGWHGIVDPKSGETLHMRAGSEQKPKMLQSYQAMPESGMAVHPPFEARTNPMFQQLDADNKARLARELSIKNRFGGQLFSRFRRST